jgi:hypothetical protein
MILKIPTTAPVALGSDKSAVVIHLYIVLCRPIEGKVGARKVAVHMTPQ